MESEQVCVFNNDLFYHNNFKQILALLRRSVHRRAHWKIEVVVLQSAREVLL